MEEKQQECLLDVDLAERVREEPRTPRRPRRSPPPKHEPNCDLLHHFSPSYSVFGGVVTVLTTVATDEGVSWEHGMKVGCVERLVVTALQARWEQPRMQTWMMRLMMMMKMKMTGCVDAPVKPEKKIACEYRWTRFGSPCEVRRCARAHP